MRLELVKYHGIKEMFRQQVVPQHGKYAEIWGNFGRREGLV